MNIAAMLTSLPGTFGDALQQVASLGFRYVDLVAVAERAASERDALADTGLIVSCASLGRTLPDACSLESPDRAARRTAVEHVKRHIADAAALGATHGYIVPPRECDANGLAYFGEACDMLGELAQSRMLQVCVEHFPGRVLSSAASTLRWVEEREHVKLLVDLGHCLISGDDPAEIVAQAGSRLGYVHLDDNDGRNDLHWPLLRGALNRPVLTRFLAALRTHAYAGAVALELNAANDNPVAALADSHRIVVDVLGELKS